MNAPEAGPVDVPEIVLARGCIVAETGFDATFSALEYGINIPEDGVDVVK
jgi:hypothetical protein